MESADRPRREGERLRDLPHVIERDGVDPRDLQCRGRAEPEVGEAEEVVGVGAMLVDNVLRRLKAEKVTPPLFVVAVRTRSGRPSPSRDS